jgi:tetratricopeptide (TPR) repeat protein
MAKNNDLFQLIKSLKGPEKRYVKLTISIQKGEKDYEILLDAYEKLRSDEEDPDKKIKKKFAGQPITNRLASFKHYLYQQILRCLRQYNQGKTLAIQINELIDFADILHNKRLFDQALKTLSKARKLAHSHHFPLAILKINQLEVTVKKSLELPSELKNSLKDTFALSTQIISDYSEELTYEYHLNQIKTLNKSIKSARTDEESVPFLEIMSHPALSEDIYPKTLYAKLYYHNAWLTFCHATGDHEKARHHAKEMLLLFESNPKLKTEERNYYVTSIGNYLMTNIHVHDYSDYSPWITKLRDLEATEFGEEVQIFMNVTTYEMVMYLDSGQFHKGISMINTIEEGLEKYSGRITMIESMVMKYNVAYLYFGSENFKKSLGYINQLLNEYEKDIRLDIHCAARMIQILIHHELGNNDTVVHLANSTRRFLKKEGRNYVFEELFLQFFKKNAFLLNRFGDRKVAFTALLDDTLELKEDPFEKQVFDYFDYHSYFRSKIESQTFSMVVRRESNAIV